VSNEGQVKIISACSPAPAAGEILFPGSSSVGGGTRLLVKNGESEEILKAGVRGDQGEGACVPPAALTALGGAHTTVTYEKISFFGVLRRKGSLALQLAIVLLSFLGAALSAYGTWVKNNGEPAGSFSNETATIVFIVAGLLALSKLIKEYSEI